MLRRFLRRFLGIDDEMRFQIARIRLQPGDVVVLTTTASLSTENVERLKAAWEALAPETRLAVLDRDFEIKAVFDRSGQATLRPAEAIP